MMAQPILVLATTLLINTLSYCSGENVYCVTPTVTSCSSCPHNSANCTTFSEYAQDTERYFTSNTTMVFLPGDHVLDTNITVANITRLTMRGESSSGNRATVVCRGPVGLSFTSIVKFKIHSLGFTFCGRDSFLSPASKYALRFESIKDAEIVDSFFHDNLGTALAVDNTNITLSGNNEFTHNHCKTCVGGGGIAVFSSTLTILSFNGTSNFTSNSAAGGDGGAIYTSDNTELNFNGVSNFINNSAPGGDGGAIYTLYNTVLNFNGTSNFTNNSAPGGDGGAIYTLYNTVLNLNGTSNFKNNSAPGGDGGAICASDNTELNLNGVSNFINNSAAGNGGAIYTLYSTVVSFNGTNNFINNSAECGYGGAIYMLHTLSFNGTSNFIGNWAGCADYPGYGGAIFTLRNTVLSFSGTTNFINNSADDGGGAIHTSPNTSLSFNGISTFTRNCAGAGGSSGGAIFNNGSLSFSGTINFTSNSADYGGAVCTYRYPFSFVINGASHFINNSAVKGGAISNFIHNLAVVDNGGAIYTSPNTVLSFTGTNNFTNNSASADGGAIYTSYNTVVNFNGTSNFINNSASADGGAIYTSGNASLYFNKSSNFAKNSAHNGGAVYLSNSTFYILPNAIVYWENNHANLGGAVYVDDLSNPFVYCNQTGSRTTKGNCFFQLDGQNLSNGIDVQLFFKNNSADAAGSELYGGAIDNCTLTGMGSYSSGEVFDMLVHIEGDNTDSKISSFPFRICPCKNNIINCNESQITRYVYPGEKFYVSVIASGQRNGVVSSKVRSYISNGHLQDFQYSQQANTFSSTFSYTAFSLSNSNIVLYADGPCSTFSDKLVIQLIIYQTCPSGFSLSKSANSCICEPRLKRYTHNCNITSGLGQITRYSGQRFWVGYNQAQGLILHPLCPFDYCVSHTVVFPLNDTNIQCTYNRSSLLCGACKEGYSLVLGTSQCKQCTNSHLVLLIPFAVMGVALVFSLLVCKLTVATGTLSGLVFYANIIGVNRTTFLPVESTNAFSVFIAWLNLDFGIETCFYDGLDAYSKAWLQFVFPVYIWLLVGLIILVSNYSPRFANLLGYNPVSVLATLILLSYAKVLRTLITALYITYLEYPAFNRSVWLFDANIDYLRGKHIPLFIVAVLVFLFLFLPYTLLLLFGQWLQAISHLRLFSWINRLKPFMDSYHAPYKAKHRYWPGLLLVLRFALLLVFAFEFNSQEDTSINLLAILVVTGVLQMWAWVSGGVYRNWCLDGLEGSFALNLIILVGATSYVNHSHGNQLAVGYTSVSIAFATFIGILGFQLANVTGITQYLKRMCAALKTRMTQIGDGETETESDTDSLPDRLINPGEYEPLLQTTQEHTATNPTGRPNAGRQISVYTYSSLN